MSQWALISIGCLECKEATRIVAVFPSLEAASEAHPDAKTASYYGDDDWPFTDRLDVIFELPEVS